jgi:hypothetical protein
MAISRLEKRYLLGTDGSKLGRDIGKISLKNRKLNSDAAFAKKLVSMPKYKGVFPLRSMRRYVTETIKNKIEELEWDRRINELPAGSNWPAREDGWKPPPEMKEALREKVLEKFRYEAAQHEFSWKEEWEHSPKELHQRAMQRAKRSQG